MAQKKNEYKTFPFQIKEVDKKLGILNGYASTFGNVDLGLDVVDQGAFVKTLQENGSKLPILADHNPSTQVGWNLDGKEDQYGLAVRGQLLIDSVQLAKEKFALAEKAQEIGAKSGLSIGYTAIKAEPDAQNPRIRHLKEIRLWEYSMVTFPMNTAALVTGAKSWLELEDLGLGKYVDLFFNHMEEIGFKQADVNSALRTYVKEHESGDPGQLVQSIDRAIAVLKAA
jgi:HK97 family phage prohead protease